MPRRSFALSDAASALSVSATSGDGVGVGASNGSLSLSLSVPVSGAEAGPQPAPPPGTGRLLPRTYVTRSGALMLFAATRERALLTRPEIRAEVESLQQLLAEVSSYQQAAHVSHNMALLKCLRIKFNSQSALANCIRHSVLYCV